MQFAVILRATDSSSLPPQAQMGLAKMTFEMLVSGQEPRIKDVYPFAGERGGVFIVDAETGDQLQEVLGNLPLSPLTKAEVHPVCTLQAVLKTIEEMEKGMAQLASAGAAQGS
jgi:muconolactone delta-isomerase